MAITTKNKTILPKYEFFGGYFGACEVSENNLNELLPVSLDIFWENVQKGKSSIKDGKILTIKDSCQIQEINSKKYLIFGLRGDNGNRKYPVNADEFVVFYNLFCDISEKVLTNQEFQDILSKSFEV